MFAAQVSWSSDGMSIIAKSLKCFMEICSSSKTTAYGSDKLQQLSKIIRAIKFMLSVVWTAVGTALNLPEYFIREHCAQMQQIIETRANVFDAIVFQSIQEHVGHANAAAFTKPK